MVEKESWSARCGLLGAVVAEPGVINQLTNQEEGLRCQENTHSQSALEMEPIREAEKELIGRIQREVQRKSEEPTRSEEQEGQQGIDIHW